MPIVEHVELGFSTADAERPTLLYEEATLCYRLSIGKDKWCKSFFAR